MNHILTVKDSCVIDSLIAVFRKKGFIKVGNKVFEVIGYRPGPGLKAWEAEFDLKDYEEGKQADALIIFPANSSHLSIEPQAPNWNGPEDGLPPVGTVCELRSRNGGWGEAEIKYHGRAVCVWLWVRRDGNTEQVEWAECPDRLEFRPIRTAEQLAAEERERALQIAMDDTYTLGISDVSKRILLERIYDAGYRKTQP